MSETVTVEQIGDQKPRFRRFARRHASVATALVRRANIECSLVTIDDMDEDDRDDLIDGMCQRIANGAMDEEPMAFKVIETLIIGFITKLIVDFILGLLD